MNLLEKHLLSGTLIIAVAILSLVIAQIVRARLLRSLKSQEHLPHERRQQALTLVEVIGWGMTVVIIGAAILMLLSDFDINITPLLASAGVAGLALSLGAQTFIKDMIGGFFILIENQYAVGDTIQVGALTGEVEHLTLRTTSARGDDGQLYIIPNGEVRIISNLTKEWSRAVVDVNVAYEEDMDHVLSVLGDAAASFALDPAFAPLLLEPPQVFGPMSLGDWAITVQVMIKTRPGKQWEVARELRKRILAACDRAGIVRPYPRQEFWTRSPAPVEAPTSARAKE
ncbi:MAG: putative MscS family protein YkuT [Chloroflexi bacterium ADurb.Bin325]|nr:MAG: putative MscS family protein YkuT [Chloroflexi bacterium ADurb.Bin325]